jgi:hypothetical protein
MRWHRRNADVEGGRDRAIERLLRQPLSDSDPTGSCLGAEAVAAWVEGGLSDREIELAETHASSCERCRALIAAVLQMPPVAPASQPWWQRGWGLGWLVPATAGALAVLIWIALPDNDPPAFREQPAVQRETAATSKPQEPMPQPPAAPAGRPDSLSAGEQPADRSRASAPADRAEQRVEEGASAKRAGDPPSAGNPGSPGTTETFGRQTAPATAVRGRATESAPLLSDTATLRAAFASATDIVSPDSSIRWRIGPAGTVQRSTDGGSTWEVLPTGVAVDLTAGASPSPSVCWLVGRTGTVLRSTDGRTWQRVAFPEVADLVAIRATDARTATVSTADGRTFRTSDGGVTWER